MRLVFASVLLLGGSSALAAARVAIHPLIVEEAADPRAADQSRIDFIAEAASQYTAQSNGDVIRRAQAAQQLPTGLIPRDQTERAGQINTQANIATGL